MIPMIKSVIAPSIQLFTSISGFFFRLLICISPPYVYIILYTYTYVNSFLFFYIFILTRGLNVFIIARRFQIIFFDRPQARKKKPSGKGTAPKKGVLFCILFVQYHISTFQPNKTNRLYFFLRICHVPFCNHPQYDVFPFCELSAARLGHLYICTALFF